MANANTHIINTRFFLNEYTALPDETDYPPISEEEMINMETTFLNETDRIHLYAFICEDFEEPYVDIYVWDSMLQPDNYERFVIAEGHHMSEEKAERLFRIVNNQYNFKLKDHLPDMKKFCEKVKILFPQWHYLNYKHYELSEAFQHMYYASFESGGKEILYKADLPYVAYMSSYIYNYDDNGSTPTRIVNNLPLRLLRILNKPCLVSRLFYKDEVELALNTYNKFHTYIKSDISPNQLDYLEELCDENSFFYAKGFNSRLYKMLKDEDYPELVEDYEYYYYLWDQIYSNKVIDIPEANELDGRIHNLKLTLDYKRNKTLNSKIAYRAFDSEYEYQTNKYVIYPPQHCIDFLTEAEEQHNCCIEYVETHAKYDTTILFLRRIEDLTKPFVTVEVRNRKIAQVYAKFNKLAEIGVYRFLQEYAKEKDFLYNPFDLISVEDLDKCEDDCLRNQLIKYLDTYPED